MIFDEACDILSADILQISERRVKPLSEFNELIKSFSKSREYVRDFFVYGFKTRDEFTGWSGRTYDNERRRIESWLTEYVNQDYTENVKNIYLSIDSNLLNTNPLYRVWKAKSFTDNDIMLHFYILDYLRTSDAQTAEDITDGILNNYDAMFDVQMVRRKCNEYANEGLLVRHKSGKKLLYTIELSIRNQLTENPALIDAMKLFQLTAPLGVIGSTIMDNISCVNDKFRVKHSFFVHTLEDEVLLTILDAVRQECNISINVKSTRSDSMQTLLVTPLSLLISTRTGRRYLCFYQPDTRRLHSARLDAIKSVNIENHCDNYAALKEMEMKNRANLWGVSFQNADNTRLQHIKITLDINEATENYILNRLEREGKTGTITRTAPNTFTYENDVFDVNEMIPWIRTFIGRIIDTESDCPQLKGMFKRDLRAMYKMYFEE